ncbi:MAG: PD40 domain-containing protein [Gemmatimonadota bacterium]|nr:MAG: PD40 domain-containing protein [Gemmatimonadota bacterium]
MKSHLICVVVLVVMTVSPVILAQERQPIIPILEQKLEISGIRAAVDTYYELKTNSPNEYSFVEDEFEALGFRLLSEVRLNEAIEIFKLNVDAHPTSWRAHQDLGEAYQARGGLFQEAMNSFTKALELHPGDPQGTIALKRMKGLGDCMRAETKDTVRFAPGEPMNLHGPYLGQEPPGLEPKVFAPGIVSTVGNFETSVSISPDGEEIYFTRSRDIFVCRLGKDGWRAPEIAPFAKTHPGHEAVLTPKGDRLFYVRPGENGPEIWTAGRSKKGWEKPQYHCQGMFATTSVNRNFYVTGFPEGDGGSIYHAPWVNGRYVESELLSANINTPYAEMHPSIAPDESFLVFDSTRPGGKGWADFYVSFRRADDTWSEAVRIDGMCTAGNDIIPTLSPDGRYVFFTMNMDIYWVDAGIIENVKQETLR